MSRARDITSRIEAFLTSNEEVSVEDLMPLAKQYAELCKAVNARLERCSSFLRSGLRTEAIYHSKIEPDVLDLVRDLDLPHVDQWIELCKGEKLDYPPRLLFEAAHELNEAYAQLEPIAELMKQQRVLALTNAPLTERLALLRSLAAADPNNTAWDDSVKEFEAARLADIKVEASAALKAGDQDGLNTLLDELQYAGWALTVPDDLVDALAKGARKVQVSRATAALRALAPELEDAYGGQDYDECLELLGKWDHVVTQNQLNLSGELDSVVQPIRQWCRDLGSRIHQKHEFDSSCAALQQALDEGVPVSNLRTLYAAARAFGQALPDELEKQYQRDLEQASLARDRRVRIGAVLVATVVVAAAAVGVLSIRRANERRLTETVFRISNDFLDKDDPDGAQKYLNGQTAEHPNIDVEEIRHWIAQKRAALEAQEKEFRSQLSNARQLIASADTFDALDQARQLLQKASELARTDASREDLENAQRAERETRSQVQDEIDGQFEKKLADAQVEFGKLPPASDKGSLPSKETLLEPIEERVRALLSAEDISGPLMDQAKVLKTRVVMYRSTVNKLKKQAREVADLRRAIDGLKYQIGTPKQLASALEKVASKFPDVNEATDLKKAAGNLAHWQTVTEGVGLVRSWGRDYLPSDGSGIQERLKQVKAYLGNHPQSPFGSQLGDYMAYLEKAALALASDGPWHHQCPTLLEKPLWDVYQFKYEQDGQVYTYYVDSPNAFTGRKVSVYVSPSLDKKKEIRIKKAGIRQKVSPSAQTIMKDKIVDLLYDFSAQSWATFGLDLADHVRQSQDVDVVIRALLLQRIFEWIRPCGWKLEREVDRILKRMEPEDLGDMNWVDPEEPIRREHIEEDVLNKLPSFVKIKDRIKKAQADLFAAIRIGYVCNAVLLSDGDGVLTVHVPEQYRSDGYKIMTILPRAGSGASTLFQVGEITTGKAQLDESKAANIPLGSMLFVWE